ncbi:olfactory receptor 14C36-like [Anas platyrhynchos]|uniref:olfactory receptor 14C36-like n=1 Tax=Anas platyrhynchos TaxID=8839 RepID=UPI003AF204BE
MPNSSSVSEFLLLAFTDTRELQLLHFSLFLGIYLVALLGNGLILTAIACDHRLHTPMYFFLLNLALLDLGCISTTLPKAMANFLWDTRTISYEFFCEVPQILKLSCSDAYLRPLSTFLPSLDLVLSFLYSVVPPAVNPLIYSIRNKDIKDALRKLFGTYISALIVGPIS